MNSNFETDEDLLNAFRAGNRKAYKRIYLTYYQDLCVFVLGYTKDAQAAEDIVQDVLLNFWENRKQIKVHTSLKAYLFKSTYYAFLNTYKTKKRINDKLEALRFSILNSLLEEDHDLKEKRIAALKQAIDELPKRCKEVFMLSKYDGLKYREIAEKLNISVNTVEGQIGRAFKILRKKMFDNSYLHLFVSFFKKSFRVS